MITHICEKEWDKSKSPSGRGCKLSSLIETTKRQLETNCHRREDMPLADELAMIVAEMYTLPPDTWVRIGGEQIPAELVAEVYRHLRHEHTVHVIENYKKANYRVKYLKTYLRTALYNAVFEASFRICNDVQTNLHE